MLIGAPVGIILLAVVVAVVVVRYRPWRRNNNGVTLSRISFENPAFESSAPAFHNHDQGYADIHGHQKSDDESDAYADIPSFTGLQHESAYADIPAFVGSHGPGCESDYLDVKPSPLSNANPILESDYLDVKPEPTGTCGQYEEDSYMILRPTTDETC